ncbi:urease accessory protein UreF [Zoogloeaceae bacteirum Par-f-2]|jgi:urease accessory protein|uniref:urease accessory protein UreF n=1 Tax=Pseudothauera hydrothermalis TaxID=2184083 RepID=UPI000C7AD7AD|nr:urease accessory UreF family protein [Pseudothauera hydrothermalis]AUM00230.1 urease accessory protein UreF [Rhodocyclaceae bacterium]AVZ79409.1 urease accessory protein UreF [Zoogloeaceae bacteirum Par-f-2]
MLPLIRLLQLVSPTLPVGAYTYSQGLEWAVDCGTLQTEADAARWIGDLLTHGVGAFEAPLAARLCEVWAQLGQSGADQAAALCEIMALNADFLASRETAELRAETVQMGYSLVRTLSGVPAFAGLPGWVAWLEAIDEPAYPTAWTAAAAAWQVPTGEAVAAYLWAWAENQVMAAVKTVPLGQSAGQRLLAALGERIPAVAERALSLPRCAWNNFSPALAIASSRHETQYTRLFRS